jgi:superfamily I DNA/RNA helicase
MIVYISAITQFTGRAPQILALGDARQAIFEFQGADARFLDLAPELFSSVSPYDWEACQLSKSFRLSHETTSFINNAILGGEQYIVGAHSGPRPLYVNADPKRKDELLDVLLPFISKYGPDNTAILVPSMKIAYVRDLSNSLLEKHRILNSPSVSDDTRIDPDIIRGKVAISTYHQFKGSERDLVVIFGADSKYFETGRSLPDDRCPNAVFVALTRARKQVSYAYFPRNAQVPDIQPS